MDKSLNILSHITDMKAVMNLIMLTLIEESLRRDWTNASLVTPLIQSEEVQKAMRFMGVFVYTNVLSAYSSWIKSVGNNGI